MIVRKQYTKGGALGSYLHAHWENYNDYGLNSSSGEKQSENANQEAVQNFYNSIKSRNMSRIKNTSTSLSSLEQSYNDRRKKMVNALFALKDQGSDDAQAFFLKVLENAELGKNVDINLICKYIEQDSTGSIKLDLSKIKLGEDAKSIYRPHGAHYTKVSTINGQFVTLKNTIESIQDTELKSILESRYKIIHDEWSLIVENLSNFEVIKKRMSSLKFYEGFKGDASTYFDPGDKSKNSGTIPVSLGQFFSKKISNVLSTALATSQISKIQGSFEEVLGVYLYGPAREYAIDEFEKNLKNYISNDSSQMKISGSQKSTMGLDINATIQLDHKLMEEWYRAEIKRNKQFQTIEEYKVGPYTDYRFVVDYSTKDKVDFFAQFDNEPVGVSAKAVQLDKQWEDGSQKIPAGIHIQSGTSLYIYLLAFQRMQAGIGNHFLNIFSSHEDGDFSQTSLRNLANKAMLSALLYSALTGDITKPNSDLAEILYVYDKSKKLASGNISRVHFFSIQDIVSEIIEKNYEEMNKLVRVGSTDIHMIELKNNMVQPNENLSPKLMRAAILQRITYALNSARKIKFDIAINNSYFRQKIN